MASPASPQPNQLDPATLRTAAAVLSGRNNALGPVLATFAARIASGQTLLPAEAAQALAGLKAAGVAPKTVAQAAAPTVNIGPPVTSPAPGQLDPATLSAAADALEGDGTDINDTLNAAILRVDADKISSGQTLSAGDQQVALNLLAQVGVTPVFLGRRPATALPGTQGGPFIQLTPSPPPFATSARNPNAPAASTPTVMAPSSVPLIAAGFGVGALGFLGWKLWRKR